MSDTSRRKFLAAAGAGTAAVGVGVVGMAGTATAAETTRKSGSAKEPVVAYVEDHHSDRLRLMFGDREVVVHDRELVTRILNAAGGNA